MRSARSAQSARPPRTARSARDRGSAAVDFVLVGSLLTLLFLAMLQLGVDLYVRSVLSSCAADGARYAAAADISSPRVAAERTNQLITRSLGHRFAAAKAVAKPGEVDGAPVIVVTVSARLPLLAWFLPKGPTVHVTGHSLDEPTRGLP